MCRLVIDSGSCTNVISEDAVLKLALFIEPHPSPYKISWLDSKTKIRITKRCRVQFSMGLNYKDLVCLRVTFFWGILGNMIAELFMLVFLIHIALPMKVDVSL